jgi:hypothetical protein
MLGPVVAVLQVLTLASGARAGVYGPVNKHVQPESIGKRQIIPSATWGPDVTLGQTNSEYIALSTIYSTGPPPAQVKGSIFLWPGLFDQANRNGGDLIQSVIELHSAKESAETCQAKPGQWFVCSLFVRFIAGADRPNQVHSSICCQLQGKANVKYSKKRKSH